MKTCPACHRPVPEGAATCPHQGCGAVLHTPREHAKRPPPPPAHVRIGGNDTHPHSTQPVARGAAAAVSRPRRPRRAWLATILIGSALVAGALLVWLRPPGREVKSVSANPPSQQLTPIDPPVANPPSNDKRAAAPKDVADKPPKKMADEAKTADDQPAATPAAKSQPSPAVPSEPVGIVGEPAKEPSPEQRKRMVAGEPTGVLADAPAKPAALGVPQEPALGIVADTPLELYAERTKPKTPEWLGQRGGTIESQNAVEDGLNWLARHQGEDGHWGADCLGNDANSRCDQKAPCQGPGEAYEVAHTGMALLAFQAAGHYYFNGQKYSDHVTKGLNYLVGEQSRDGSIVGSQNPTQEQVDAGAKFQQYFMYEHAMATFALCEACALAIADNKPPDKRYLIAAERAVLFIENVQHSDGGWRYTAGGEAPSDCSVSGWVMLALKTAREAKIAVLPATVSRMMAFFERHHMGDRTYYFTPNQPGTDAMTGVGMMAVEFFQHKLDSPVVTGGAAYLADKADQRDGRGALPDGDYYLWYNCTMAMFQAGGDPWDRWNNAVRDLVTSLQVQGAGCDRGSWPPADRWSSRGGRIYSTALAVLTLEVYYRFQRVAGQSEKEKFFGK